MRGKVLHFNASLGTGVISGDDGKRYSFTAADIVSGGVLPAGTSVDFEAGEGVATAIYVVPSVIGEKNKWIAALLAFFFGPLGVHKFYLGQTGAGIIMLIGTIIIIGLPFTMLISFIELIVYLVKSEQQFYEDYVVRKKSWF
jgi:TM2 domain-containing membrane protein YozV/cold shock CspA family protein